MNITSEITQVGGEGFTEPDDGAVYLINIMGKAALVDAGCGNSEQKLLENIKNCGIELKQIEYLLLTHCHFDHSGGGRFIKEITGCYTIAHQLDAVYIEKGENTVTAADWFNKEMEAFPIDIKLKEPTENIDLGNRIIQAIHIPGHSPGSVAYLMESDGNRVLFGQDVHGPLHSSLKSNKEDYRESLKRLLSLEADILCEGHYGVFKDRMNVSQFIRSFL